MSLDVVKYRRAGSADYEGILKLQAANYVVNLSEADRREGFLSAEFSREQVAVMAEDLGIMIAVEAKDIVGYLCAFRNDFNHGSPVLAAMLNSYDRVKFEENPLSSYNSYIYGPVCIAKNYRRQGLLRGLYEAHKRDLMGQFDVGVAFVASNNLHSLQAHIAGLGMVEVGDFEVKGNRYVILAFRIPRRL